MRVSWTPYRRGTHDLGMVYGVIVLGFVVGGAFITRFPINLPACWFHRVTGYPCATCGTTRCFIALAHGDLSGAFAWNPMIFTVSAIVLAWGLWSFGAYLLRWPIPQIALRPGERRWVVFTVIGLVAANWIYLVCFLR